MAEYNGPNPPGDLTEEDMLVIKTRSRHSIMQRREEALHFRRQYENASLSSTEIPRDLEVEIAVAAVSYHGVLNEYRDEDILNGEFPDASHLKRRILDGKDVHPEQFAQLIDDLEEVAHKLGFISEVER